MPSDTNIAYLDLEVAAGHQVLLTKDRDGRYTAWICTTTTTIGIGRENVTKDEVDELVALHPKAITVEN